MPIVQRKLTIKFELGQTPSGQPVTFQGSTSNVVTLSDLRAACAINKAGTPAGATLSLRVYGMRLSLMNQLATLGMVYSQIKRNTVIVMAGDATDGLFTVFVGTILQAWTDFSNAPDVAFHVEAQTLGAEAVIPAKPTSINGSADVAQLMAGFASQMGLTFENNGVDAKLPQPYFYGSAAAQAAACARAAGISWFVDNKVLAIWPQSRSRGGDVPVISPSSGLVQYPGFTAYGLMLKVRFNPALKFGGSVKVESSLEPANAVGTWTIYTLDHDLSTIVPHGPWFTSIVCYNPNFPRQVAGPP